MVKINSKFCSILGFMVGTFCMMLASPALAAPLQTKLAFPSDSVPAKSYRENHLMISGHAGGGDYPFAGFGITLMHQKSASQKSYWGFGVHYISNTIHGEYSLERQESVQIFPILLDYRKEFSRINHGKFATYLFLDAGYVVSITGNERDQDGEYKYGNGWAINPGISFKYDLTKNTGIILDLGWFRHNSKLKWLPPVEKKGRKKWDLAMARLSFLF